jgi:hypothetical protein
VASTEVSFDCKGGIWWVLGDAILLDPALPRSSEVLLSVRREDRFISWQPGTARTVVSDRPG